VPELRSIKPVPEGQPVGEVILVHGLGGDQEQTWRLDGAADRNWPGWLNEDLPSVRVRTLGYDAPISAWSRSNSALPLTELATACLAELQAKDVGAYPVVFICHSLGGLVVKQMIRHPDTYSGHGWEKIRDQIRGVSFFGTPHSGAKIANWAGFLNLIVRPTVSVEDMEHHTPALKDLNSWFRNYADRNLRRADGHVSVQAFRETEPYSGAVIVDEVSADPALPCIALIPLQGEDHVSICKFRDRDATAYRLMLQFVRESFSLRKSFSLKDLVDHPSAWSVALEKAARHLERDESVNVVVQGDVDWWAWLEELRATRFSKLSIVDLENPAAVSRNGLISEILRVTGRSRAVPPPPDDLPELARAFADGRRSYVAFANFRRVAERKHYGMDLFSSLRFMVMHARQLILLVQTRQPVAALLPPEHEMSPIDFKTVELG
jgi:hypothetical protein